MADREDQIGAIHRVEMKRGDAAVDEVEHLLGGDCGGDQLARRCIVFKAMKPLSEPARHRGAAALGKAGGGLEVLHRQDARHDRDVDSAGADTIEISEIKVVLEEKLGNGAGRPRVDLGLEHVDIGVDRRAIGVFFRIGRDGNLKIGGNALDAAGKIGGVAIAAGMRCIFCARTARRVAAQRHDMAHAHIMICAHDPVDFIARGGNAGQMRGRRQWRLGKNAFDRRVSARARGTAGAVGH